MSLYCGVGSEAANYSPLIVGIFEGPNCLRNWCVRVVIPLHSWGSTKGVASSPGPGDEASKGGARGNVVSLVHGTGLI